MSNVERIRTQKHVSVTSKTWQDRYPQGPMTFYDMGLKKRFKNIMSRQPNKWVSISKFRHLHNIRNRENH